MHSSVFIYGAALLLIIYTLRWVWHLFTSPTRAIPGPFVARFTRLWYFKHVRSGSFHHENIALHEKYGPICRVAPNLYSISSPDKTVYGIGSKFPKGDWYQGWKHPSPDRWTLFPEQNMKRHAETRKRFQNLYSMSSLLSYEGYVDDCIDIFINKLKQFARSGQVVDLVHWFQCYAFDVMGEITYSERFGFLDNGDDIEGTMAALDRSMLYSTLVGIFPYLHPYLYAIMEKLPGTGAAGRTYLMKFVQKKINDRNLAKKQGTHDMRSKSADNDVAPQDFLDKLSEAQQVNPEKVTPYHIFMMGLSNIIAGSDTTAVSLCSVFFHLLTSPSALQKLRQEIDQKCPQGQRVTFKISQDMPYLQAVIKEALRLHPATGLPLWRVVPEGGFHIEEYSLPAGTNIGINTWVAHYDKRIYGDDAHLFRPERWEEAKENDKMRYQAMEANFMPFGLGSRTCLGRHISTLEMSKLVPEIVRTLDLDLTISKEQWKTINYWFVKPERLPVTVRDRDTMDSEKVL
ncbi:cytochrome P450 oxidoreductase [Aaosphaeria arxii CBS 175.79]|uniref:Cytochrome P450 oxidoreductase n=1 Tax=Aaosphaeria arxii CBS 175.79 TaxID=1450172 RepID=A0A6A5X6V4_9PLEO|nr:cytochrome P450 oxidoreductase [Aaosphaeria arxii CBS 175.79]KAF2008693.1 cytochrome P450 oxidoreductase [Aaosphaeria arxii CBS 175.79]